MELTEIQQHILSYFNLIKVSTFNSALTVLEQIFHTLDKPHPANREQLLCEIQSINKVIQDYELEIVESIDEISSEKLLILINTADNNITQKSKFYEKSTTQLFSKIVKNCILSKEGHISEIHSLNLSSQVGVSKATAQSILEKLVKDKWLVSKDGRLSLGMRSIVEMEQTLKQLYPDEIKNCPFCKLIVVQGYNCGNCNTRCHFGCLTKYTAHSKSKCACPSCKVMWNYSPVELKSEGQESESFLSQEEDSMSQTVVSEKRKKRNKFEK